MVRQDGHKESVLDDSPVNTRTLVLQISVEQVHMRHYKT